MEAIPTINLVAVAHLYFVSVFIGVYASEAVVELYSYFAKDGDTTLAATAKFHYWIDTLVEIPTLIAIFITGVWMAFLVEKLTTLHWILIGCAVCLVPGGLNCIMRVRKRHRLLAENAEKESLRALSKKIMLGTIMTINPFLLAVLIIGAWLAYHRVLDSIYG